MPENTALIADGGLATGLEARGQVLSDALWSARLLVDAPQEITAVQADIATIRRACIQGETPAGSPP